jgi:hypothetical protein
MITTILLPALLAVSAGDSPAPEAPPSQVPTTVQQPAGPPAQPFPPPPPRGLYRGTSFSFSVGPGWLALRDDIGRDSQSAIAVAGRVSSVVYPNWLAHVSAEHTTTDRGGSTFSQTAVLLGGQRFFFGRLYLGGAIGLAWVRDSGHGSSLTNGPGFAYSGTVGAEILQAEHVAVTAELAFTMGHYKVEKWEMGGLRFGIAIF